MKLKTLEMQGFKSFPEKTVLEFDRGVTAVVGPNGSGKSNISDAMRWVLGEISSKSIRGTKMEDVIFGGTDNRRPMGFCEVSLTIDNTDPDNRMAIDYDEVTVTRRYYRSGESEYLINRKPVRLRDITEMFMNTGIGRSGYSIVSQGKAAEIISQKSDERRNIFEEAAGIAKYRHKKNEAERKLSEVEDNLVRIGDIVGELESRVGPLEKEAEKARRYLELYERKKAADVALTIFDISDIRAKEAKINSEYEIARHELEMADDSLRALETKTERLYDEQQKHKMRTEELARLIREMSEKKFGFESSGKVFENEIEHIRQRRETAETELAEARAALESAKDAFESANAEWEEKKAAIEVTRKTLAKNDALVASLSDDIEKNDGDIDTIDETLTALREDLVSARILLSSLAVSEKGDDEHRSELTGELDILNSSISDYAARIEKAKETIAGYEASKAELKKQLDIIYTEEDEIEKKLLHISDRASALEIDIRTKNSRIETLSRMEAQLEGYAAGVRAVMNAAENVRIRGICGPVSRLINVDSKYATAVESALGANMQNIVVETDADAKAAIRWLRDNRSGRATFYPITTVKPKFPGKDSDVSSYKGYVGMANELVVTDEKYRGVVDYLLCRTAVFTDLDTAGAMAKDMRFTVRTVTLDGQLINTGGSYTGGSAIRESGMLTRSNQIDTLRKETEDAAKELEKLKEQHEELSGELENKKKEEAAIGERAALFGSLAGAEDTQKQVLESQLEADKARAGAVSASISGMDDAKKQARLEYEKAEKDIADIEAKISAAQDEQAAAEDKRRTLTLKQSDAQQAGHRIELEITAAEKDIEAAAGRVEDRKNSAFAIQARIDAATAALVKCDEDYKKIDSDISQSSEQAKYLSDEIAKCEAESASLSALILENEKKETTLREESKDLAHRREVLFRDFTRLEASKDGMAGMQDKLTAHLMDEYELTFTDALALGLEPLTEETRKAAAAILTEMKSKLRSVGNVNVGAIEEYAEVSRRYTFLKGQFDDLSTSRKDLGDVIFKLEKEMREKFITVFEQINANFKNVFRELFGGGNAEISLTDPTNVLTSGIDINVAPPGKIIKNLSLLSGGEQSFVAIALFFSILKVNPTPFCFLDEIEAALDDVNVSRFAEYCTKLSDKTQFIVITHRRGTMEYADTLYGVTMYERGVSKVLSVNVGDVEAKLGVKL